MLRFGVAATAAAASLALGYWLGRRRTPVASFRPRRIGGWSVRMATPADAPSILALVRQLAEFEKMPEQARLTADEMRSHLADGAFECLLLEVRIGQDARHAPSPRPSARARVNMGPTRRVRSRHPIIPQLCAYRLRRAGRWASPLSSTRTPRGRGRACTWKTCTLTRPPEGRCGLFFPTHQPHSSHATTPLWVNPTHAGRRG